MVLGTLRGLWNTLRISDLSQQSHFTDRKTEAPQGLAWPTAVCWGHCTPLAQRLPQVARGQRKLWMCNSTGIPEAGPQAPGKAGMLGGGLGWVASAREKCSKGS